MGGKPEAAGDMRTAANLEATGIGDHRREAPGRQRGKADGAVATFNSDDIRRIVENADLEALVITQTGEFKVQPRRVPPAGPVDGTGGRTGSARRWRPATSVRMLC